jgi:hypothetical protein
MAGPNRQRQMEYKEGSTVKVRLYSGQEVTAEITAIVSNSAGRKIRIVYEAVHLRTIFLLPVERRFYE